MKREIITIAGNNGAGKSSTANKVAQTLGYSRFSSGGFMREMAKNRGISLEELSKQAEVNDAIDKEIDSNFARLSETDKIVVDSRLGFHFIPNSFKVFLKLDPHTAAERILGDIHTNKERMNEAKESLVSVEEIEKSITKRHESEKQRYQTLYNIADHTDESHFDLVIDTKDYPLEEVAKIVLDKYKSWQNS